MDVLSDVIATTRTGRPVSGMFERHAPWGRRYPKVEAAGFHVVLQGACVLLRDGAEPVALAVGDVVFMPRGCEHALADRPDSPLTETARPGEPRHIPGPGVSTTLLCGSYELAADRTHPLLAELPEVVHIPARLGTHPALRGAVDLLAAELAAPALGADAAVPPLLDLLLLYMLRARLSEGTGGWAAAFADPAIAAALRGIHADPRRQWTVEALGELAGLSRAAFAKRFTAAVGEPPLAYLTRWRMITAARLLREGDAPLATVARQAGYGSEFAFGKAFKREYGCAPGRYRRDGRDVVLAGADTVSAPVSA
ncbi:AraC family transcriptional regulator [Phytomonospora endophytica]|uniref:AraC-like DNA-binding protein n=1 Tax=Phytomonospora endophytica TaxID=714109 RepID=A0A841FM61_9ACTN|nr:AraC family transcriptional regulator [Phytomonospora endophytica]MBB6036003.1 AraC-like DNA-binding protein [Phytomonospora endophytica]GIG66909.1 AraC family transcriptional regulator [Phytomonospora endophytica]